MESVILTTVINDHEEREVAIAEIKNTFIQTKNSKKVGNQIDIMKVRGKLA